MSNIELDELPKSKEFMKHAKIADGLTKETGLEHGFTFCKPKDKIIVDKMCTGTECNINITPENCGELADFFHTHPNSKWSDFSAADMYHSIYRAQYSNGLNISCIKADGDKDILCEKTDVSKNSTAINDVLKLIKQTEIQDNDEVELELVSSIHGIIKPKAIAFNAKTGKIYKQGFIVD